MKIHFSTTMGLFVLFSMLPLSGRAFVSISEQRVCVRDTTQELLRSHLLNYSNYKNVDTGMTRPVQLSLSIFRMPPIPLQLVDMDQSSAIRLASETPDDAVYSQVTDPSFQTSALTTLTGNQRDLVWIHMVPMRLSSTTTEAPRFFLICSLREAATSEDIFFEHICRADNSASAQARRYGISDFYSRVWVPRQPSDPNCQAGSFNHELHYEFRITTDPSEVASIKSAVLQTILPPSPVEPLRQALLRNINPLFDENSHENFVRWYYENYYQRWLAQTPHRNSSATASVASTP